MAVSITNPYQIYLNAMRGYPTATATPQQQEQQVSQIPQPLIDGVGKGISNSGMIGNGVNQLGGMAGVDLSTLAGHLGGGTQIGGTASSTLPTSVEALFSGGAEATAGANTTGILGTGVSGLSLGLGLGGAYGLYDVYKNSRNDRKGHAIGAASGAALGTAIMPGIGTLIGLGLGAAMPALGLNGKSTKEYQQERRDKVVGAGNQGWGGYYSRNALGNDKVLPTQITRDEKGNWIKADGSWDAREYAGVQGNADTFGDDWFKLKDDQRDKLVTQFKNEGLYHSNKGDVLIADDKQARAKELYLSLLSGKK